jgi:integrase
MARPTKGSVTGHVGKDGRTYRYLRLTVNGKRQNVRLGPVSAEAAEEALRHALADVERGIWQPPTVEAPPEPAGVPTFHAFAEEWWVRNEKRFAPKTRTDYRWRLAHLLPHFAKLPLDSITFDTVERYVAAKLAEDDPLSPRSINMTVILLGAILESAVERELIARNPAKGKGRRVRERAPGRSYLETAAQIEALLDAAGALDREATRERRHVERRAMLATLTFAGLRIGELCALRWRDVDLAAGWLKTGSKTDAGRRRVKIRGALRDVLLDVRARRPHADPDGFVFATRSGGRMSADNFRARTLRGAVERADADLAARDLPPLPERITPHSLRRTFCSLLYALGEPPPVVMAEMGHTDPGLALAVYAQAMRRGEGETAQLRALVEGGVLANSGKRGDTERSEPVGRMAP